MRWRAGVLVALLGVTGCSGSRSGGSGQDVSVRRTDTGGATTSTAATAPGSDETTATTTGTSPPAAGRSAALAPRPTVWVDATPTTRATEEGDPTPAALPPAPVYQVPEPPAPAGTDDRATAPAAARRYTLGLLTGEAGQSWEQVVKSLEPVVTPAHRAQLAASGPPALGRTTRVRVSSATQMQSGAWRCSAEVYDLTGEPVTSPTFQVWDLTVVPGTDGWRVQAGVRVA
jgi:hypothetical protein